MDVVCTEHESRLMTWRWGRRTWLANGFRLCQLIWDACVRAGGRWSCESDSAALSQHLAGLWTHMHRHTRVGKHSHRALPPQQVDKRDHLQSGGINSTPAHTQHTPVSSDVESGGEKKNSSSCFGFVPVGINAKGWRGWRGRPMKVKQESGGGGVGGGV